MYDLTSARPWQHVSVLGSYDGQAIVNIFAFRVVFPSPPQTASNGSADLLIAFRTWWRTTIGFDLPDGYVVSKYVVKDLNTSIATGTPSKHWIYEHTDELAGDPTLDIGGSDDPALPTFATANLTLKTAKAGRRFRGRKAYGPLLEAFTVDTAGGGNRLTTGGITSITTGYGNLLAGLAFTADGLSLTLQWQVHSLVMAVASPISEWGNDVTTFVVQPNVGSQVSRKKRNTAA